MRVFKISPLVIVFFLCSVSSMASVPKTVTCEMNFIAKTKEGIVDVIQDAQLVGTVNLEEVPSDAEQEAYKTWYATVKLENDFVSLIYSYNYSVKKDPTDGKKNISVEAAIVRFENKLPSGESQVSVLKVGTIGGSIDVSLPVSGVINAKVLESVAFICSTNSED